MIILGLMVTSNVVKDMLCKKQAQRIHELIEEKQE